MGQPFSRDFFYMRPFMPPKMSDRFCGILSRTLDRLLGRISDLAKDAPGLTHGISDTECLQNQARHTTTGPNRVGIPEFGRPFLEETLESGELFRAEFRLPPRPDLAIQAIETLSVDGFSPPFDARKAAPKDFHDLSIAKSLLNQPAALNPAVLHIRMFVLLCTHDDYYAAKSKKVRIFWPRQ
jgi:hypothetical protein